MDDFYFQKIGNFIFSANFKQGQLILDLEGNGVTLSTGERLPIASIQRALDLELSGEGHLERLIARRKLREALTLAIEQLPSVPECCDRWEMITAFEGYLLL